MASIPLPLTLSTIVDTPVRSDSGISQYDVRKVANDLISTAQFCEKISVAVYGIEYYPERLIEVGLIDQYRNPLPELISLILSSDGPPNRLYGLVTQELPLARSYINFDIRSLSLGSLRANINISISDPSDRARSDSSDLTPYERQSLRNQRNNNRLTALNILVTILLHVMPATSARNEQLPNHPVQTVEVSTINSEADPLIKQMLYDLRNDYTHQKYKEANIAIQTMLKNLGLYDCAVDGKIGRGTAEAVRMFNNRFCNTFSCDYRDPDFQERLVRENVYHNLKSLNSSPSR
jgi:hypothetical protein